MSEQPRRHWIWTLLRRKKRSELDTLERDLIMGRWEKRRYAGDPNQPRHLWVRTRNREGNHSRP